MYCKECGCEVDLAAWNCANCGANLHDGFGAATSIPSNRAGVLVESAHAREWQEGLRARATHVLTKLVAVLGLFVFVFLIERYLFPDEIRSGHRPFDNLPSGTSGHPNLFRWLVLGIGIPLLLWLLGIFDRRRR